MFRYRNQLRRWAALVLALLLFGVGAGIAHACLVASTAEPGTAESGHAVATYPSAHETAQAPADAHHASAAIVHQGTPGDDPAPGKANCQDFCNKSTITIAPLKLALDHADAGALPPPAVTLSAAVAATQPLPCGVLRRDGGAALPITIAFVRLAL